MPKTEYDIDGRAFRVERRGKVWAGWFWDAPNIVYVADLKGDVLSQAGYLPPGTNMYIVDSDGTTNHYFRSPKTMQQAYQAFRSRFEEGHRPIFPQSKDRPLRKFDILARDECRCFYCGTIPDRSVDAQLDHIVPVTAGGQHVAGNIVTACFRCNGAKGNSRLPDEAERLRVISERNQRIGIEDDHPVDMPDRSDEVVEDEM